MNVSVRAKRAAVRRGRHAPPRRPEARSAATSDPSPPAQGPLARDRRFGGPEDRALYRCGCGYAFQADVSASVGCPMCGDSQAW